LVAPLGVKLEPRSPHKPRASLIIREPYFVCLGTIEARKNQSLLIRVWEKLVQNLGDNAPRLVMIGRPGWHYNKTKKLLAKVDPKTRFIIESPGLSDNDAIYLMQRARALLFPTLAEGFGLPVGEALVLHVPVLCSDLGELREVGRNVPDY